jgi:HAMP domain-containing protein
MLPPFANEVLGAMITPAVLISACGTLTLSTSIRLGRVVDRVRAIGEEVDALDPSGTIPYAELDEERRHLSDQLGRLVQRIHLLQTALTSLYTAIGLLVGTSLAIGLKSATNRVPEAVPVLLGLLGAGALFFGSVYLVREARTAVSSTLREMEYIARVVARKTGVPPAS